ncbi:hypothetical protein L596_013380 [Steinernema carpocapsae]|uniref:Uncharacterized protein n=1 Tax=Steinernema carpocapsae TaxID=34508 RepID=A0A4U5P0U7_STECR|nr:hypothetical protein L596_013380 [Steinernema carpocapsae]
MHQTSIEEFNKKIDSLLEEGMQKYEKDNCLIVKTFYYDEDSLLFLKFDDNGSDIGYWVAKDLSKMGSVYSLPT